MLELLSEPLYILAQVRMQIGVRVSVEAAATIGKILATLLLLWLGVATEAVAVSLAQVFAPLHPSRTQSVFALFMELASSL